ncbi:CYTH and CHAD domain-containing protein [Streptomyces sp. NPDC042319]|uniref:CYTH and CHAD domain-containing protein n=1 Tax=Streptomyces sp. NPDC042319 TaxID=3154332 RepID=UPI0033D0D1F7
MADTVRETERKYEADGGGALAAGLPELTGVGPVASVVERDAVHLDATYYDTAERRLARDGITLRRRTGGDDAGWHLKLPVADHVRDEIRAPLAEGIPRALRGLVRSRVRDAELLPVVRIETRRELRHLMDEGGTKIAELAVDEVRATRPSGPGRAASWTEIEVELAPGGDPAVLDAVDAGLRRAGLRPSAAASKAARAWTETAPEDETEPSADKPEGKPGKKKPADKPGDKKKPASGAKGGKAGPPAPPTALEAVLAYVTEQVRAIVELDPAVRRDQPDSVHRMRVATRRLRSAFRSYAKVLDRAVTDPVGAELKWLAGELGVDRDREVLTARLHEGLSGLPRTLQLGPVRARLKIWSHARRQGSRKHLIAVLDGPRYLALLATLDALLADPPTAAWADRPAAKVLPKVIERDFRRLAGRIDAALATPQGAERDAALHAARKAAKRTRYAAEAARPELGKPAKKFAKRMTVVQDLLGDHQDSVVARGALRDLGIQAHGAGESSFTFGLLYGREESRAADRERELPALWAKAANPKHRRPLHRK